MTSRRHSSVLEPVRLVFASRKLRRALAAFAILYAWEYLTFFSSVLTKQASMASPCLPEHCWAAAGLAAALCSLALLVVRKRGSLDFAEKLAPAATALMGACSLGIWALYAFDVYAETLPYACAGAVGLALPFPYLYRVKHFPPLEAAFLGTFFSLAFIGAPLIYLLFILLPAPFAVAFCTVAPAAFLLLSVKQPALEPEEDGGRQSEAAFSLKPLLLNCASAFILIIWLNFAFFRIIAAPWDFESQAWYYPSLFVTTLVVLTGIFLFVRLSALRNRQRGQARFAVVAFAVSYLILYVRFYNPLLATIAFAFCFACMIALEALAWSFWYQTVKEVRSRASVPLLAYLAIKGVGLFAGVALGEWSCLFMDGIIPVTAPLLFLILLFACAMALKMEDFDKLFAEARGTRPPQGYVTDFGNLLIAGTGEPGRADSAPPPAVGIEDVVDKVAERYALSPREMDVARLLLAGRNRPFIKDALFISTGTVNSHISSIYRKTGVKSQQELISLAERAARGDDGEGSACGPAAR